MRMVCDPTYILNQQTDQNTKIRELSYLLGDLLEDKENKVVIFSQWKRMFELVIRLLHKMNVSYEYLNGDLSATERKRIIEKFQGDNELKVFLSTDAGEVGINLPSANILINLDLPRNPAVLEQRIGRIFRLGQKKHVNVYNFISKGSIEHRILYLPDFKKSVFTGIMEEEGEDEVMLERFMESVKTLTEAFNDPSFANISGEKNMIPGKEYEVGTDILPGLRNESSRQAGSVRPAAKEDNGPGKAVSSQNHGLFSRFKVRILKILKGIFAHK